MSRIISFAWTTPALITGNKTCTRREWDGRYAQSLLAGSLLLAYDRSPRARGNHVANIMLTTDPYQQPLTDMPDEDYELEGFKWLLAHPGAHGRTIQGLPRDHFIRSVCSPDGFERWRQSGDVMWVVRFQLIELTTDGIRQRDEILTQVKLPA